MGLVLLSPFPASCPPRPFPRCFPSSAFLGLCFLHHHLPSHPGAWPVSLRSPSSPPPFLLQTLQPREGPGEPAEKGTGREEICLSQPAVPHASATCGFQLYLSREQRHAILSARSCLAPLCSPTPGATHTGAPSEDITGK